MYGAGVVLKRDSASPKKEQDSISLKFFKQHAAKLRVQLARLLFQACFVYELHWPFVSNDRDKTTGTSRCRLGWACYCTCVSFGSGSVRLAAEFYESGSSGSSFRCVTWQCGEQLFIG